MQDSGNEIWYMYLDEVKEDNMRIAGTWKEYSNGILVFVKSEYTDDPLFVPMTDKNRLTQLLLNPAAYTPQRLTSGGPATSQLV
jgi:hypothetical protein